ncbi:glycine betaine/L-proline ABC transporter ATP-binding protein [Chloroflexi bacterium TSY]|nr:glycine betaine/L-proline ABC transporter ATP-binding protein [Chloroflexi bacterium TSY]
MPDLKKEPQIVCRNLWKIFGPRADTIFDSLSQSSNDAPGHSRSRQTILEETGHVVAVRDVSFQVAQGETFVIMGLSGSGKSTLLRCLTRLIPPTAGKILIGDDDILALNDKALRNVRRTKMSMVFQHFGLFPHRQVIDNVAYGLEVQGIDLETRHTRAQEVIDLVTLNGWEFHYPNELSGGMQQRVGIARALAVDPDLLMFDEPFSALDPLIRREMQDELLTLQTVMHKTILFITHDFLEAVKLGDRIAIMKDGEIEQVGTPADLVLRPANDYVQEFTKDVPRTQVLTASSLISQPSSVVEAIHEISWDPTNDEQSSFACLCAPSGHFRGLALRGGEVLTELPTVSPATSLGELIPLAMSQPHPIPVVDLDQKLMGLVTHDAILQATKG